MKSDIRLIEGDVESAAQEIIHYLPKAGYKIDERKISQNCADITARILQQSVAKLYITNSPQIVNFHLKKISEWQIQIDTRYDLIKRFRIFYYAILVFLLFGCIGSLIIGLNSDSHSISPKFQSESFLSFEKSLLFALACFISAVFFYLKSISTFPYENFLNKFYDKLAKKGFANRKDIHVGHGFPDMWKALFLLGPFFLPAFLIIGIDNVLNGHAFLNALLNIALLLIGLFIFLLILMNYQPTIKAKIFFALAGFSFCIPIILYFSPPAIMSITGDLHELFNKHLNQGYPQKIIQYGSTFYLSFYVGIIIISFTALLNTLHLPVRIIMQLDKSAIMHPASYFNQSFQNSNFSFIFNSLVLLLWGIFLVVKIVALYFSLTIAEISIFGSNFIFKSNIAVLFFENTKSCLLLLFRPDIANLTILIFHKIIMLLYSAPMLALVYLILRKNIKATIDDYRLTKSSSIFDFEADKNISIIVKKICLSLDIRVPLVRVIDSKNIDAIAKFIGFPFFKNILIVSKGAFEELNNKDELELLLAHEIGHIKKHTLMRRFLCFFSDYSLFGNGFLAMLQNSYTIEREADYFAVKWVLNKHKDKRIAIDLLKSILEKIEESTWKNAISQPNNSLSFSQLKNNQCRSEFFKMFNDSSMLQKLKINFKLFIQIYFGEEIQSYIHPTNNQRIEWIERKFNTNEAN